MSDVATILANGKTREVPSGSTILDLLNDLGWKPQWVVVEHNGEAVERSRLSERALADGDRLEIVRAVAGGAVAR